jgi:hypothetical protein
VLTSTQSFPDAQAGEDAVTPGRDGLDRVVVGERREDDTA